MKLPASEHLTLVEVLELTASFEDFAAVAQAAVRRLEAEAVAGLVRVQFYGNPGSAEIGAILTFADPGQILEHIARVKDWPEFKDLIKVVRPREVRVYGTMNPQAQAWIRSMNAVITPFETHIAGFVR